MAEPAASKKEETRRKDLEQVLEFKQWLLEKRCSLPFEQGYIDNILASIEEYRIGRLVKV
jgi:hypothetical protein